MIARGRFLAVCFLAAAPIAAELCAAEPADVKEAIRKGVEYLKSTQNGDGTWSGQYGNRLGGIALAGLALCESGVPESDPAVRNTAEFVRTRAPQEWQTYDLALAIMFLDKLTRKGTSEELRAAARDEPGKRKKLKSGRVLMAGQVADSDLIVDLGRRLLQGQGPGGAWTYNCQRPADGDHSNTQFAVLGVWVAGQHGLDVAECLARCAGHFRSCQTEQGGWSYGGSAGATPSMTCAGLIGLAAALGMKTELSARKDLSRKGRKEAPIRDQNVEAGFRLLESYLGGPGVQQPPIPPMPRSRRTRPVPVPGRFVPAANSLYFLWSLERVGVLYGTEQIGNVAWYSWGVNLLVGANSPLGQRPDGSWSRDHGELCGTSFALLFLNRANVAPELAEALEGKFDSSGGLKAYRSAAEAMQHIAERAADPSARKEGADAARTDAERSGQSIREALDALREASDPNAKQAALAELEKLQPTYAEVKEELPELVRLFGSEDTKIAAAARRQLVNAFQRAPISHCLHWLGQDSQELRVLIWEQLDGRIARADEARREEYRKVAAAVLREKAFETPGKEAAMELLTRIPGDSSAGPIIDTLLEMPRELWPQAGQSLRRLTGKDFGPRAGDGIAQVIESQKQWRAWQQRR